MSGKTVVILTVLVLCLAVTGCQKLDEPAPALGTLQISKVELAESIPREYGRLVGVTPDTPNPHWAVLWFVKPDESVVALRVNVSRGKFSQNVLTIPRN